MPLNRKDKQDLAVKYLREIRTRADKLCNLYGLDIPVANEDVYKWAEKILADTDQILSNAKGELDFS